MTEAEFEGVVLQLRAWVRPLHGEIQVLKHDNLPALTSKDWKEFMVEESIVDQTSVSYVHEGVGASEVVFLHAVPAANALLRGANRSERHFLAAYYTQEAAANSTVRRRPDGTHLSANMRYYGESKATLRYMWVFGSPVKFLISSEIRASKFDEHARPGWYAGPWPAAWERCCTYHVAVWDGLRYVKVEAGCLRVDERVVLSRSSRDHPQHQPFSLAPAPDVPSADFSTWSTQCQRLSRLCSQLCGLLPHLSHPLASSCCTCVEVCGMTLTALLRRCRRQAE
jgi:hypothetical protein